MKRLIITLFVLTQFCTAWSQGTATHQGEAYITPYTINSDLAEGFDLMTDIRLKMEPYFFVTMDVNELTYVVEDENTWNHGVEGLPITFTIDSSHPWDAKLITDPWFPNHGTNTMSWDDFFAFTLNYAGNYGQGQTKLSPPVGLWQSMPDAGTTPLTIFEATFPEGGSNTGGPEGNTYTFTMDFATQNAFNASPTTPHDHLAHQHGRHNNLLYTLLPGTYHAYMHFLFTQFPNN